MSRRRRRASDLAPTPPRRGLAMLVVCAIALALVIAYKVVLGEQTAGFFTQITGESELELPPSVLDRLDAGPDAAPDAAPSPVPDAAPSPVPDAAPRPAPDTPPAD